MSRQLLQWTRHKLRVLPVVMQNEIAECGHACIAMVSGFWGNQLSLAQLRQQHRPSLQGITLRQMQVLLHQYGFSARPLRVALTELAYVRTPAILHWNMNHFVVLKKVKKHGCLIHDPALGARYCTMNEVSNSFTGVVLEVSPGAMVLPIPMPSKLSLLDVIKNSVGLPSLLMSILLLSLCLELFSLANPCLMQYVIDHVVASNDLTQLWHLVWGWLLLTSGHALTEWLRARTTLLLSMQLTEQLSTWCMRHLLRLPSEFFAARRRGDIQSKMRAVDEIQRKLGTDFIPTLLDGVMAVCNWVVMYWYSPLLTALVSAALIVYSMLRFGAYYVLKQQTTRSIQQHANVASVFLETLNAITAIKLYLKESLRFNQWHNGTIEALNADIRIAKNRIMLQISQQWLFGLEQIAVVCFAAKAIMANQFSLGMLLAFLGYRQLLVNKTLSFMQHVVDYRLLGIQLQRLSDIVLHPPEIMPPASGSSVLVTGQLDLQHVSFRYDAFAPWIVQELDLTVQAGEKVVLVGPSGCGKSTVLKIMMGLIQPTHGELRIDGQSLTEFGASHYRQIVGCVMQDDVLLSGSILDNICFFDEEVDYDWVYTVAHWCGIHDTIRRFTMGYETLVGDMGSSLSGGQKQRILLARALYKKPKILFLDEATSHLDADNERAINGILTTLNITQVSVAHREETIKMADRVIQLIARSDGC